MSQFSTQIHKLSLDSKDGVIVGDVFSTKTEKGLTDRLGYIFGLIELIDMPDQFIDRFFEIVEDLRTEYYLPPFNLENGLEKDSRNAFFELIEEYIKPSTNQSRKSTWKISTASSA